MGIPIGIVKLPSHEAEIESIHSINAKIIEPRVTISGKILIGGLTDSPESVDLTFKIVEHDILVIDNAFNKCDELILEAEKLNKWTESSLSNGSSIAYVDQTVRNSQKLAIDSDVFPSLTKLETCITEITHAAINLYCVHSPYVKIVTDTGYELIRYKEGQYFKEHIDAIKGHSDWGSRRVSCVIFLNDSFDGGDLIFTRQNLRIKPKAGTIVLFPSDFTHPHASKDLKSGTKYSIVTWFI